MKPQTFQDYTKSHGVNLLRDDIKYIRKMLVIHERHHHKAILKQYVEVWTKAMQECDNPLTADNIGRRAANSFLRDLYN